MQHGELKYLFEATIIGFLPTKLNASKCNRTSPCHKNQQNKKTQYKKLFFLNLQEQWQIISNKGIVKYQTLPGRNTRPHASYLKYSRTLRHTATKFHLPAPKLLNNKP